MFDNAVAITNKKHKETVSLGAINASIFVKKHKSKLKAAGVSQMALILAACGGSSDGTSSSGSTLLSLTKSGDTYSPSAVTGFTLTDSSSAKFDVADAATNAYSINLNADGSGLLEFDFADADDVVTLEAGSKVSGFTTLKITDGTIDATGADLSSITRVEVASGVKLSLDQVKAIPTLVSTADTGSITIEVATEAEATELVALLKDGTVSVYGESGNIKVAASDSSTATITAEVIEAKQTEVTAEVKDAADAPIDTSVTTPDTPTAPVTPTTPTVSTDVADPFTLSADASGGNYSIGTQNGAVTLTKGTTLYKLTPTTGSEASATISDVTSFVLNGITLNAEAAAITGETVTGTGSVALTALDATPAADLSNISVTGTRTAAVSDDVTFTGNLGTFTTTVASGKTMTGDVAVLQGELIDGAGTVAVTDLDTDLDADLSTISATTVTATFNDTKTFTGNLGTATTTIAADKTMTAAHSVVTGEKIAGTGNLTITSMVDATDVSNISTSGTITVSGVTTAANLTALDAVTTTAIAATGITAVSGTVTEAAAVLTAHGASTINIDADYTATLTGTATSAQLNALNADTSGNIDISAVTAVTLEDTGVTFSIAAAGFVEGAGTYTITGGDLGDTITGGDNIDTIDGGAEADTITGGNGADEITVGSGNDIVVFDANDSASVSNSTAGAATGSDTLKDFIIANDKIKITGELANNFNHATDVLVGAAGGTADEVEDIADFAATTYLVARDGNILNGFDTAVTAYKTGTTAAFVSDTEAQNVTFYDVSLVSTGASVVLGALGDTATGGAGDDTVIGGKGADIINGGDGTDVVSYSDVAAAGTDQHGIADAGLLGVVANFTASAITTATIDTAMDTANTSDDYFTFGSTAVAANVATYIIAAADTAGGNVNDTYSNVEGVIGSERADYLALGTGAFSAVGGAGKDYILGGVGNNTITGGAGADTLVGGDGDDTYVYLAQAELVASNAMVDQITEASSEGTDTIQLSSVSGTFTIAKTDNFSTRAVEMESITVVASSNAYSITTHADFVSDTGIAIIDLSGDTTAGGSNVIDMSNQTTTTAMTVTGSAGVDTITLQETSADTVKGGAGIDVLDFNGGTTADVLDVTGANSTGNYDTVAQFVVGSDKIALDAAATTVATASGADAVVEDEATAAAGADGAVYDLATALDLNTNAVDLVTLDTNVLANISNLAAGGLDEAGTINDGTELLKALVTAGAGDTASGIKVDNAGDSFYILTDDGTDSYLYFLDAGDNDVAVAAEIILVADFAGATLDGIAAGQIVIA